MAIKVELVANKLYLEQNTQGSRDEYITVKQDDTLTKLAKMFGMSVEEFKAWTGIENNTIKVGQKIKLPTAKVKDGQGLYAFAKEHGMTMAELAKLNSIQNPSEYKTAKDEIFYINPKSASSSIQRNQQKQNVSNETVGTNPNRKNDGKENVILENQKKWGSSYSPEELCSKIHELFDNYAGAVGKPVFEVLVNEINPKNASAVIQAYPKNEKSKDSLLHSILCDESSKSDIRKATALKIYDALAKEKNAQSSTREDFVKELDKQLTSQGSVDTKKLDSIIDEIINKTPQKPSNTTNTSVSAPEKTSKNQKVVVPSNKKYPNQTMESLRTSAIASGKNEATLKFKEYCKAEGIKYDASLLDFGPIERYPYPTVKGTSITTLDEGTFEPTGKSNGRVVIINPGHGGYSNKTGYFDPGSYSFVKKANGKYAPLLEYDKMQAYKQEAVEKLRAQGYTVVVANAHLDTFYSEKSFSKIVQSLNNGSRTGKKYDKKDIMFISLHADEEKGASGSGVCYDNRFADDTRLAKLMQSNLNEDDWIKADLAIRNKNVPAKGLEVLYQTNDIPSVLLEVEYVDGARCQNLDSSAYQTRFINKMIEGINEYFGI